MKRVIVSLAMLVCFSAAASAACVKPQGTYTGAAIVSLVDKSTGDFVKLSSQSTYVIPSSGQWRVYGAGLGVYESENPYAKNSAEVEALLGGIIGVTNNRASPDYTPLPGINGTTNKFDTTLCQGQVKAGEATWRYVVSNNGATIQMGIQSSNKYYFEMVFVLTRT
jgi:hypothetical protein